MISIVTTCLDYSDFLAETYKYNVSELKKYNYWIVTEKEDKATNEFCKKHDINVYHTDQFRAGGCAFNKSRALNSFFYDNKNNLFTNDWILLCDADVIIAPTIKFFAEKADKDKRCLYSTGYLHCSPVQGLCEVLGSNGESAVVGYIRKHRLKGHIIGHIAGHINRPYID